MTLPTPEMTPSCRKLCSRPSGRASWTSAPSAVEAGRYQLHQRLRPGKYRLEHHEQQAQQDDETEDRVQQHGIEPRGQRVRFCRHADGDFDDAVGLALGGAQFADGRRPPAGFARRLQLVRGQCVEAEQQFIDAAAAHRRRGDDRHAELGRHAVEIDIDAAPRCDVDHVEDEQQRPPDAFELDHQPQGQAEIGGVGDTEQQIRRRLRGETPEHDVARHFFIGTARAQRIGARQIDKTDAAAGRGAQHAGFALDGHARIVRDLLPAAGQRIEQRGLAAVRRSDQSEAPRAGLDGHIH